MLVRMRLRQLTVFVALGCAILCVPLPASANPDAIQALYKKALRDSTVRLKLITAGVLNASSDIVPSNQLKDAATLFVETYARDASGDSNVMARLDDIVSQYNTFTNLRDSNYKNNVVIKIPARLLATLKDLTPGVETLHLSGDGSWALRYGTYRYPLRAQTPQSLLREIFYRNENLVVELMQSDENGFEVSGFVRNPEGTIERHFLRKAFQVGGSTTAIYMQYAHTAPADFAGPVLHCTIPRPAHSTADRFRNRGVRPAPRKTAGVGRANVRPGAREVSPAGVGHRDPALSEDSSGKGSGMARGTA